MANRTPHQTNGNRQTGLRVVALSLLVVMTGTVATAVAHADASTPTRTSSTPSGTTLVLTP